MATLARALQVQAEIAEWSGEAVLATPPVCLWAKARAEAPEREPILESEARADRAPACGTFQVEWREMRMVERQGAGETPPREFAVAAMLEVAPARWRSKLA